MDSLANHWVIGIGGGLITGLLVMLIIRQLASARAQREYQRRVAKANSEIIAAIRPAITEKVIPSGAMLDALFSATARKHGVNSSDLLPKAGFANELMKEVIDNAYLSSQQKVDFCQLLAGIPQAEGEALPKRVVEIVNVHRRADIFDPSAILGLTAGLTALSITLFFYLNGKEEFLINGLLSRLFPLFAIVSIVPIIAFTLLDLARQMARSRREPAEEKAAAAEPAVSMPARDFNQLEYKPMQPTA
jgi:hypothetical protein